jgi:hypothetical protein
MPNPPHTDGDAAPQRERFAQEVDYAAPKPGRCLGYASFRDADLSWMLRVIEGPSREDLTFRGMVTDFEGEVELVSLYASSSLLDTLADSPLTPTWPFPELSIDFGPLEPNAQGPKADRVRSEARIDWAIPGSERDLGPDAALVTFRHHRSGKSPPVPDVESMSFTAIRRGWDPISTLALVSIAIVGGGGIAKMALREGRPITLGGSIKAGPIKARGKIKIGPGDPRRDRDLPDEPG